MKINHWMMGMLLPVLFASCEQYKVEGDGQILKTKEISFSAEVLPVEIGAKPQSRAVLNTWENGDMIGVYMKKHGSDANVNVLNPNTPFITQNGNGVFYPKGDIIPFPEQGSYDFIAYYPFSANVQGDILKLNVKDQSNPAALNLLYADNLKNITKENTSEPLSFKHKLLNFEISLSGTSDSDLSKVTMTLKGVPTTANFNVKDGSLKVGAASQEVVALRREANQFTAILLPMESTEGASLVINTGKQEVNIPLKSRFTKLLANTIYKLPVTIEGEKVEVQKATYKNWLETPVIADAMRFNPHIHYVNHDMNYNGKTVRNFSLLYDDNLKMSYWVAYPLVRNYCNGAVRRPRDVWAFDPNLEQRLQVSVFNGFGKQYGYDRGHQIPNADRNFSKEGANSTFISTNMTPQVTAMNQNIWADLESKVRSNIPYSDTLYVVTGAAATSKEDKHIDRLWNGMTIPKYYYKALAKRVNGTYKTIAFKLYNRDYNDKNFAQGAMSVADLEKETGFTFFPNIPAEAKSKLVKSDWGIR